MLNKAVRPYQIWMKIMPEANMYQYGDIVTGLEDEVEYTPGVGFIMYPASPGVQVKETEVPLSFFTPVIVAQELVFCIKSWKELVGGEYVPSGSMKSDSVLVVVDPDSQ